MDLGDLPIGVMRERDMLAACMMSAECGSYGGWKARKAGGVGEGGCWWDGRVEGRKKAEDMCHQGMCWCV